MLYSLRQTFGMVSLRLRHRETPAASSLLIVTKMSSGVLVLGKAATSEKPRATADELRRVANTLFKQRGYHGTWHFPDGSLTPFELSQLFFQFVYLALKKESAGEAPSPCEGYVAV